MGNEIFAFPKAVNEAYSVLKIQCIETPNIVSYPRFADYVNQR
jgi:hypothetical protein